MIPLNEAEAHLPAAEDDHPPGEPLPWGWIVVAVIWGQIEWVGMW